VRVFPDTNVLVSAYMARGLVADLYRLWLAEHEIVIGEVVIEELHRLLRERFRVPEPLIAQIMGDLAQFERVPKPTQPSPLSIRDPDDAWVLASAVVARVDALVTGDQDLLAVADRTPLPILSPRQAWDALRPAEGESGAQSSSRR